MAEPSVTVSGPLFEGGAAEKVGTVVEDGLLAFANDQLVTRVRGEMYPGHGYLTGHMHDSVQADVVGEMNIEVNTGNDVPYAVYQEALFGFFENAADWLAQNNAVLDEYIGKRIKNQLE